MQHPETGRNWKENSELCSCLVWETRHCQCFNPESPISVGNKTQSGCFPWSLAAVLVGHEQVRDFIYLAAFLSPEGFRCPLVPNHTVSSKSALLTCALCVFCLVRISWSPVHSEPTAQVTLCPFIFFCTYSGNYGKYSYQSPIVFLAVTFKILWKFSLVIQNVFLHRQHKHYPEAF
jgi:hypothetical protein